MSFQALETKVNEAMKRAPHQFDDADTALIHELGDALKLAESTGATRLVEQFETLSRQYIFSLQIGIVLSISQETREKENRIRKQISNLRANGGIGNRAKAKWLELANGL